MRQSGRIRRAVVAEDEVADHNSADDGLDQ